MLPPKKILVRLPSWVGDVVMCTPALRALRRAFPVAEIVAEGKLHQAELVVGLASVDRYLPDPGRSAKALWTRSRLLRKERFDWAVLLGESERVAIAPRLAQWTPRRAPAPTRLSSRAARRAVSYTHLTLPTICSV